MMILSKAKELSKKVTGHVYIFGMMSGYVVSSWTKKKSSQLTEWIRKPFR